MSYWLDNYDHAAEQRACEAADLWNDEQAVKPVQLDSTAIAGLIVECDDRQKRARLVQALIARLEAERMKAFQMAEDYDDGCVLLEAP